MATHTGSRRGLWRIVWHIITGKFFYSTFYHYLYKQCVFRCRQWSKKQGSCWATAVFKYVPIPFVKQNQGCGSVFILCGTGSGSSSFFECGSGSRSSWTKFEEKKSFSQVIKNIKHCSKLRTNEPCENLLLKNVIKLQLLAIFLYFFSFSWQIYPPGSASTSASAYWIWIRIPIQEQKWMQIRIRIHSREQNLHFFSMLLSILGVPTEDLFTRWPGLTITQWTSYICEQKWRKGKVLLFFKMYSILQKQWHEILGFFPNCTTLQRSWKSSILAVSTLIPKFVLYLRSVIDNVVVSCATQDVKVLSVLSKVEA